MVARRNPKPIQILTAVGFLILSTLGGCDVMRGPIIFNESDRALDVVIQFTEGSPVSSRLNPHQFLGQFKSGRTLDSVTIEAHGNRRLFSKEELRRLLDQVHVSNSDDALVILADENTISVRSYEDARRDGFFSRMSREKVN